MVQYTTARKGLFFFPFSFVLCSCLTRPLFFCSIPKYRYAVVMQHCRFPPPLMPRVVAFHADRAEPDANALVWVKKKTSQKRHKEDSYLKVVQGHIYQSDFFFFFFVSDLSYTCPYRDGSLNITFPDGSLVNQFIAHGWGFTASLFTYKRKRGHINVSPSRAVTQIRAKYAFFVVFCLLVCL